TWSERAAARGPRHRVYIAPPRPEWQVTTAGSRDGEVDSVSGLMSKKLSLPLVPMFLTIALALPAFAQTPNTAALVVAVVDQTGAVVSDARVCVINRETGATRD